jgi:3-oxoacyl-[acyl-carrier-protein] synthase III
VTAPLTIRAGRVGSRIAGVGSYLPRRIVTNEEMCTMIDSSDEWIRQRTGIIERRWASEDESLSFMVAEASRKAIEHAKVSTEEIDAVIVATVTHLKATPALAPMLAAELGLKDPAAYDISAACAGFCYALAQADSLIRTGASKAVLIVAAERLSDLTDKSDRSTAFLFADGAGAAVVVGSDTPGVGPVVWGSDGSQADVITQTEDFRDAVPNGRMPTLYMDGKPVFRWATTFIADAAKDILTQTGIEPEQLDVFIPHQANNRITDSMLRHLKLPEHVVVARSITHIGNTSASTIPIAMDELLSSGEAKSGQTALLIGFGAGLVYAGQVVVLP